MVDITIVSMGFINQQTYLQGPTLYHVLACFVTIEDALPCARRSLVINQAFCLLLICSTNSYVNPLNPNFIVKTYLNNNVWIYIYIYIFSHFIRADRPFWSVVQPFPDLPTTRFKLVLSSTPCLYLTP